MKIVLSSSLRGSVLLTILLSVVILGISIGSYLNLVASQNRYTARSQAWNGALPVLEAGVEEALTHIHYVGTNLNANNWLLVTGAYTKERVIGTSKYYVTISTTVPPTIYAYGYVREPLKTNYMDPPRTVKVTTTNDPLFKKGMVAKGLIDFNGKNVRTDSFDSADPLYSTGGVYDPAKIKSNGDVATNRGLVNSINSGNASVYGHVSTGPGGSVAIGANGSVGDLAWHNGGHTGVQSGYFTDDMNVSFKDVSAPFAVAFSPAPGIVGGTSYDYVLGTGNYQMSSLSMSGNGGHVMLVTGNAVLYVTGNVSLQGNASIQIAPGGNLQMYVAGSSTSLGGNGIVNQSGNALNFAYYGLPSNTSLSFSGNGGFTGTIYAPQADFSLGGGGNNTTDFIGASITSTVTMNGHFNFHYDENLARFGPPRDYVVATWNELLWNEM